MATLKTYKGIEILKDAATGDGGRAISEDFEKLADRTPFPSSSAPSSGDDSDSDYEPGSLWLQSDSGTHTLWMCLDATVGAASWVQIFYRNSTQIGMSVIGNAFQKLIGTNAAILHLADGTGFTTLASVGGKTHLGNANNATTDTIVIDDPDVGLGTAEPEVRLHVKENRTNPGTSDPEWAVVCTQNVEELTPGLETIVGKWIFGSDYAGRFIINDAHDAGNPTTPFYIQKDVPSESFVIREPNGDTGIGTYDPATKLQVEGAVTMPNMSTAPGTPASGYGVIYFEEDGGGVQKLQVKFANGSVKTLADDA